MNVGSSDFLAVKIDSIGNTVWKWQVRAEFRQFVVLTEANIRVISFGYARDGAELRMATLSSQNGFSFRLSLPPRSLDAGRI